MSLSDMGKFTTALFSMMTFTLLLAACTSVREKPDATTAINSGAVPSDRAPASDPNIRPVKWR